MEVIQTNDIKFNCYRALNDLGLIYLQYLGDTEKAYEYIKQSAFGEYPFGQNNFGLICLLYQKNDNYIEYMFEKASKQKFSLSEYNLGYMKEKNNMIDESIDFYVKASEHEDEQLIFHQIACNDKRLNVSKTFILCYTNLKLFEYFYSKSQFIDSKKYFVKAFHKLIYIDENIKYVFKFCYNNFKRSKNRFTYLKSFILNFPLFNLKNQSFLKLQIEPIEIIDSNSDVNEEEEDEIFSQKKSSNDFDLISYIKLDKKIEKKEDFLKNKQPKSHKKKKKIFNDPSELFDFIIENNEFKNEFIAEIKEIIEIMGSILYTPPYLILFGRINLAKIKSQKIVRNDIEPKQIDASFYEGFGND